jgi:ribose/xylose/arabinose/galactoside ABC-type transport system permease subunit
MTKAKASLQRHNRLFLLVAVLVIATVISRGVFIRPTNLILVMASAAAFGLVSFGQALVVIGGGFDLAVGSLVAMSISGIVFFRSDFGILGGTIGALAAALVAGLISGLAVSRTKIPPFIVTLGMLSVADSMAWIVAAGQPITVPSTMTPSRCGSKAFFSAKTYFRSSSSFSDLSPQACSSIGTNGDVTSTLSATTNRPRESPACR